MHIDIDAFFTSVEQVKNPGLKNKPVVVGADPKGGSGRGVVSTASYEARKYGVHSAQPISIAWRRLKGANAVFLPVNMPLYIKVSGEMMKMLINYSDRFEQASIDEIYLDLSGKVKDYDKAEKLALIIKKELKESQGLTCSIGIGSNKLISKIAANEEKPDGLTIVKQDESEKFLAPLSIRKLPGIGPKSEEVLNAAGIKTISDLALTPQFKLEEVFGKKSAQYIKAISRGIDESPVEQIYDVKSVGRQYTFEEDTHDLNNIFKVMGALAEDSMINMKEEGFKAYRTVTVKVRYSNFETHTSSHTLKEPHNDMATALTLAIDLIRPWLEDKRKIRLIGFSLSKLEK